MSRRRDDPPVAAYLRLSIASDDSVSIAGLKGLVAEEARCRAWGDPVLFVDEGVSGSKDVKRPARDAIEARLAAGEFRALIVKSVDRLAHSTADFAQIVKICKDAGTALVVTDIPSTPRRPEAGWSSTSSPPSRPQ